jgi:hypothetical protein
LQEVSEAKKAAEKEIKTESRYAFVSAQDREGRGRGEEKKKRRNAAADCCCPNLDKFQGIAIFIAGQNN